MTELMDAHKEWRFRPASERYATLAEMHAVTEARRQASRESRVRTGNGGLRFEADPDAQPGQDLVIRGEGTSLVPTAWSLEQLSWAYHVPGLSQMVGKQPAQLAAQNLNWAVRNTSAEEMVMLWANGGNGIIRGFNTTTYTRLWDADVIGWLRSATADETNGWHRPPAMTDGRYPSGYYSSDRDIFVFMINDENRIDDGSDKGLGRGVIVRNTEVNGLGFHFRGFLYEHVCGNHIVWGAQQLFDFRAWHMGSDIGQRVSVKLYKAMGEYLNSSAAEQQAVITLARGKSIGKTPAEAIKFLTAKPVEFNKTQADQIVTNAVAVGDDPTNLWALVNSATALSQQLFAHANQRQDFDVRAGKILDLVATKVV